MNRRKLLLKETPAKARLGAPCRTYSERATGCGCAGPGGFPSDDDGGAGN